MKYFLPLCLFVFWIQSSTASAILFESGGAFTETESESEKRAKRFGSFQIDLGLSRFNLLDSKVRSTYYKQFGKLALMPEVRLGYFFHLNPFAIGLGFGLSYHKASGKTDMDGQPGQQKEDLVFLPYQFYLDLKLSLFDSFFITDVWVAYKEAFIENRRAGAVDCEVCNEKTGGTLITEKGFHWNNYLVVGTSFGFSLHSLGNAKNFRTDRPFGLYDVYVKLFGEYDIDLKSKALLGGRKRSSIKMASWRAGLLFTFEL